MNRKQDGRQNQVGDSLQRVVFGILSFVIIHIYMITTGHTILAHTRAMISGWEEVKDIEAVEDWEVKTKAAKSA